MSFEPNDMNTIHLGNYQEFFILYMDNELNEDRVRMVEEFLAEHPDLSPEFDMLMGTKLPLEQFSFDKKDLLAENMKRSSVDEELLLYVDNELPSDKKKTIELELASNKAYQLQHQLLLQTRLDPSEKIAYPHKKELYRKTERTISIKVWMSAAAAVVIMVLGGIVYFKNPPSIDTATGNPDPRANNSLVQSEVKQNEAPGVDSSSEDPLKNQVAVTVEETTKEKKQFQVVAIVEEKKENVVEPVLIAGIDAQIEGPERKKINTVQAEGNNAIALHTSKEIINTGSVTSLDPERTMIKGSPEELDESSNRKGSFKGFLRKATRMIEKRTGIDPTDANGDLLIGAVAINLK